MAFDESKYRAAAKAAGYSDDEINAELNTKTVAESAPAGASMPPAPTETFSDAQAKAKADYDARVHKALTASVTVGDHTYEIPSFFTSPAGIITAAGAGIGLASTLMGAAKVAPKTYNAIKDRWISKAPAIDRNVDIPFETPKATFDAKATTPPTVEPSAPTKPTSASQWDELIARSEKNRADKLAYEASKAGVPVVEAPVVGATPSGAPVAPVVSAAPVAPVAPEAPMGAAVPGVAQEAPSLKQAVDSGVDAGQALKSDLAGMVDEASKAPVAPPTAAAPVAPTELRTGTGKPAFAGEGPEPKISARTNKPQFKDIYTDVSQVPKGYAFVPNAQYIDIPRQDLGQAEYTKAYTGKDFPATNELAREQSKEINRTLGRGTREEAKLAGLAPAEVTPGITKMTTAGKKRVMVGGALGALVALPELASAATQAGQGNVAPAKEMGFDLATGAMLAKLLGGPAAAAGALALGSSGLNANEEQELARRRAVQEYSQRVGAGRGIAPPSSYMR